MYIYYYVKQAHICNQRMVYWIERSATTLWNGLIPGVGLYFPQYFLQNWMVQITFIFGRPSLKVLRRGHQDFH
jgi:hypothetical protein